jgi:hypothetical protein
MTRDKKRPSGYAVEKNIAWLTRRRDALLKQLGAVGPLVNGSVVLIARTCGNSSQCRCSRGHKHVSTYLTYAEQGKTRTLYVPVDLEKEVRQWSARHRQLKQLIRQLCELQRTIIRKHVQEQRRRR